MSANLSLNSTSTSPKLGATEELYNNAALSVGLIIKAGHATGVEREMLQRATAPIIDSFVRLALECAAHRIENLSGNPTYKAAWKIAARTVRASKPD